MPSVRLSIEPDLCGPISVGTARVAILLRDVLGLELDDAIRWIDRCVFDGAEVSIPISSRESGERFLSALARNPRIHATLDE